MKTLLLSIMLVLASTSGLFAQHHGGGFHAARPAYVYHPAPIYRPVPPPIYRRPVVIYNNGYYGYNWGLGFGWYPYSYWNFPIYSGYVVEPTSPCKKEKLKDSEGRKHEVLVCRQPDGTMQVVADADHK